ncbi:MAG: trypsin-like serine protease, partial [Alphaproteobacteria bacterium]|nr:trypsin-like serine protease [Alphaproteobacteria bacterium]
MHTTVLGRNLRTSLLSGVSALSLGLTGLAFSAHEATAVVARDDQAATVPVTYQCVLGPGGGATTTNVTAGALADGCASLTYVGYTVTDLTPAPFNLPGFIGQCTGTLINPRMVLTAAHCYNEAPQSAYGTGGTIRHAMSFSPLPLANNALSNWLFGTAMLNGQTNNGFTDIASVRYAPGNIDFLQGDIAIVTLANPVTSVGTSPILMSALDQQRDAIVNGYGLTGNGTGGATISSRVRRAGQNNVGANLSIDDLCFQVFGLDPLTCNGISLPQNLYWSDFDSLTTSPGVRANPFDFDLLPGASLPREAMTGGGDSGSSLFVTIAGRQVSLGPLSGSFRFFGAQAFGSYGTASFYQPAYLYANWIASVNPTRYYVAKAGNQTWNSGTGWDEFLDPNFLVLSGGNLVNGIPAADVGVGATTDVGLFNDGSLLPADGGAPAGLLTASANIASVADLGVQSLPARTNQLTDSLDLSPAPSVEGVPPAAP